ncbi:DME family drug/metabolite transporter [Diaminobutyricimonas aerilata]|uniref:DME family drug/metabolite transporter n=1 Tax=Diaminobutyricimonas aerilata TaxID=1162967 RepID=A0A2M9CFV0_9MICO|nr:EamA family transporter [Diaminobutyricimonas aerilata]PJJ70759.1 DME family drug/metabolite transporter [Diaminobutyricimonas aerilata]
MSSRTSFLALVVAGLCWGTGGVLGRELGAVADASALTVAACRLVFGGLLLLALHLARRGRMPRGARAWRGIAALAVLAAAYQGCYFGAVSLGDVGMATLLALGSAPLFVLLIEALRDRRMPGALALARAVLAVAGLALLIGTVAPGEQDVTSVLLALASGLAFAFFTVVGKHAVAGVSPMAVPAFAFTGGGVLLALLALPAGGLAFAATPTSVTLLIALAAVPTALAYGLFFAGLAGSSSATASIVALLEPLTATALSVVLYDETLGPLQWVGAALLLVSIGLSALDRDRGSVRQPTVV